MSSDNFIAIVHHKGSNYIGYHCCASHNYPYIKCFPCLGEEQFKVRGLRNAIDLAQEWNTEYGYSLHDWKEEITNCPCELKKFLEDKR